MKKDVFTPGTHVLTSVIYFLLFLLPACHQYEEIRPLAHESYHNGILPQGNYQAVDEKAETSPYQMIIRTVGNTGKTFTVSNFADMRLDVQMEAIGDAIMIVPQNLGHYRGTPHVLLSGSMRHQSEDEYIITYQVHEGGSEFNRVLLVTFIGPCK